MTEALSAVLGLVLPYCVKFLNQNVQDKKIKNLIAQLSAITIGFLVAYFSGEMDWQNIVASMTIVSAASNIAYKQYFQDKFTR